MTARARLCINRKRARKEVRYIRTIGTTFLDWTNTGCNRTGRDRKSQFPPTILYNLHVICVLLILSVSKSKNWCIERRKGSRWEWRNWCKRKWGNGLEHETARRRHRSYILVPGECGSKGEREEGGGHERSRPGWFLAREKGKIERNDSRHRKKKWWYGQKAQLKNWKSSLSPDGL